MCKIQMKFNTEAEREAYLNGYELARKMFKKTKGEWIRCGSWSEGFGMGENYGYHYKCSVCGNEVKGGYASCGQKFCDECGSDNRSKEGEAK